MSTEPSLEEFGIKKTEKKIVKKKVEKKEDKKDEIVEKMEKLDIDKDDKKEEGETKKKVKVSTVDSKTLKAIEKSAERGFDLGTKKKKKKRNEKVKKIIPLKLESVNDDTDQFLDKIKEQLKTKQEEKPEEKKETAPQTSGYWTAPLKSKDDEKQEVKKESITSETKVETGQGDWIKTERDYYYEELVDHVYSILKAKNPSLNTEKSKRIVMKPPQVLREGTTKTNFANFADICSTMNRPQDHVQSFLLAEMGSTASIDGNGCLIIKGKWQGKGIESLLRKYMQEYVVCQLCGSMDTVLSRNSTTRLFSLHCSTCNANRTVTSINKGYQTIANKKEKKALAKQE